MAEAEKNSILVVDDEKINLDILTKVLCPDYTVYLTKNGSCAIEMANQLLPDLILLDIIMPDMNGYEVLEILKTDEKTRHIPVIFITGLVSSEDEEKGLALQAADYIAKPLSPAIVKLRVGNQIQIVNQIRANKKYAHKIAASEERSKFFARMSHEMRTPLNAVIGLSEITLEGSSLDENAAENILKICNAGTSLLHMVNEILDISKYEDGKFNLTPVEYSLPAMINDTVTQSIPYNGAKPVKFILDIDKNIPLHLYGDDQRIKQILNNFLSNAFKYTKEGTVELDVKNENIDEIAWLTFSVRDTGIGIPSGDLGNIFNDYFRMDSESNRQIAGTGLGLPITKMLADAMGGAITVESEYGKGSCFTVKLPQKLTSAEIISEEIIESLKKFQYITGKRRNSSRITRISLPYANVLIVDDIITNIDVIKAILKPYRMNVYSVTSGQAAVDAIRNENMKYNAIFMDQMMPEMDGFEATRIIREEIGTEYAKTIPVIAVTANALHGNEEIFLSRGFQAFITKPIDIKRLDAVIKQWVYNEEQEKLFFENKKNADIEYFPDARSGSDRRTGIERRDSSILSAKIQGMDFKKGLERFSGDMETFKQILQSFSTNTRILLDSIKDVSKENLAFYAINVHGVKSSCRGICAEETGMQAEKLEFAAKNGDIDFVIANNLLLIEDVLKLIANIDAALSREISLIEKPKKDRPYREALDNLREACEDYKIEIIENAINEIECFEYTGDKGLVQWLRENVNQMNYSDIVKKLSGAA